MTKTLKPLPDALPAPLAAALDGRLADLHAATAELAPDPALETRLLAAFDRKNRMGSIGQWLDSLGWGRFGVPAAALTLSLGMAGWVALAPLLGASPRPLPMSTMTSEPAASTAPFIALQSMERIALEPQPTVISTTFPRAMLANYGMAVSPERAGEPVRADMLVASNGQPLALRIIE